MAPFFPSQLEKRGFLPFYLCSLLCNICNAFQENVNSCTWPCSHVLAGRAPPVYCSINASSSSFHSERRGFPTDWSFRWIHSRRRRFYSSLDWVCHSVSRPHLRIELLHNFLQIGITVGATLSPFIGSFVFITALGTKGPF